MTVDWHTGIHVWYQLGDNILNDWDSVLYHAVYTLNQGPIIALFLLQPVYRDLRMRPQRCRRFYSSESYYSIKPRKVQC